MVRERQRGESKIGCIFGVIVLIIAVFVAIKVIPTRVAVSALQDYIEETAQRANLLTNSEENPITQQIADKIYRQAKSDNLPLRKEDISVVFSSGRVNVEAKYTVIIDLMVYKYEWKVEHNVERLMF